MNYQRLKGLYRQAAGRLNEAWGQLTDDPERAAAGRRTQIEGIALQRNGRFRQESARELREFVQRNRQRPY